MPFLNITITTFLQFQASDLNMSEHSSPATWQPTHTHTHTIPKTAPHT